MFMFRSKRNTWTKRLVKARKRSGDETRRSVEELLRRLQDNQLEMLAAAIERHGRELSSNCILLPRDYDDPHVRCCQLWRWPDLSHSDELRRLPMCRSGCDPVYICCNPYHWSRLLQTDSPPPPYSRCAMDRLKPEDRAPSEAALVCRGHFPESLTTDGESSLVNSQTWCKLAYWERSERVGELYLVESSYVHIFGNDPCGNGFCLQSLAKPNYSPPDPVCRTRSKIGLGITIARENEYVWVYNHSDQPIFVHSVTLEDEDSSSPVRVESERCLCVFDPFKAAHHNYGWNFTKRYGPVDVNSVQISFGKGWGPGYSRSEITLCNCWLQLILLAPCR